MKIYLAELSHTGRGRSPNTVPLAAGYLAATSKKHFPDVDVTIFRDPNQLLRAARSKRPDLVGFSIYAWSEELSRFCAQKIKENSEKTVIVAGGASVDDIDAEMLRFLRLNSCYDLCVANEGEFSFLSLLEHLKSHGRLMPNETIEGCARLSTDGTLLRGSYELPDLSEIPSPYLEGFLDSFLLDGYEPIIESMRGCPYSCKFCVSGTPHWSKLRAFDLDRVFAEFEYIEDKTRSKYLLLTDENLGILKERDVSIAEYIIKSYKNNGFPSRLYFYSAKIITDYVLKVIETLAPIGSFGMSFQTLDEKVRKEIKRTNIRYDDFLKYIQWGRARKIAVSTEMIFGFPGETADNYIKGLEKLLRSGVDRISSYNLRLLSGIDLNTQENRAKYGFKTMYRLPERTFGCYDGSIITETEEVVVGCNSFNYDDYQKVRKYGLFLELASGRRYLSELMQLMMNLGMAGEKLIMFLTEHKFVEYPRLYSIVKDYTNRIREELFETPQACTGYVRKLIADGMPVPEVKLNYIYTGKIIFDNETRDELFEAVRDFVSIHSNSAKEVVFFNDYIDNILAKQIVSFIPNEEAVVYSQSSILLDRIEQNNYSCVDDLLGDDRNLLEFELHRNAMDFIEKRIPNNNCSDESIIQDIYMTVTKFGLLRLRRIKQAHNLSYKNEQRL